MYRRAAEHRRALRNERYATDPELRARYAVQKRKRWWRLRDQLMAQNRAWQLANRERHLANMKRWHEANRDYVRATMQTYRAANRDHMNALGRQRYVAKSDHINQVIRAWRVRNPDRVSEYGARRRAATAGVLVAVVNRRAVIERDRGICYLCGGKPTGWHLTLDHVVPLADGGEHSEANLKVSCRSCNSRKNKLPLATVLHRFNLPAVQAHLI